MALIQMNRDVGDPGATVLAPGELWLNLTNARLWGGTTGGNALLIDPAGGGGPYLPLVGGTLTGSLGVGGDLYLNPPGSGWTFYYSPPLRVMQWAPGQLQAYNEQTGLTTWQSQADVLMSLDQVGNLYVQNSVTTPTAQITGLGISYTSLAGNYISFGWNSSNDILGAYVDGTFVGPVCDARVKTVVGPYRHGLAEVLEIQPIVFRYLDNEGPARATTGAGTPSIRNTEVEHVGVTAQDVERIIPQMVRYHNGVIEGVPVNDLRSISIEPLVYALLNSVKELAARVAELEAGAAR